MRVVEVNRDCEAQYEAFVSSHPNGLLYYSLRFRDFLHHLLGCEARYALALEGDQPAGVLPLMVTDGRYGQVCNSLPYYGSNGGILALSGEAQRALAQWYEEQLRQGGAAASTVIANPLDPDPPTVLHDMVDERIGHITSLEPGESPEEGVWRVIDPSARRNVRKAVQGGVEVTVESDRFKELELLHRESMAAAGGTAKTGAFFEAVASHFRAGVDYRIYLARVGGKAVAALLLFYYGTTVEYYVPALDPEHRSLQPMAAILHRAMTEALADGFVRWNWGGSWLSQESLIRFKSKWGGRPRTYKYWTKVNRSELRTLTPAELLAEYPGFYVLPFSELRAHRA